MNMQSHFLPCLHFVPLNHWSDAFILFILLTSGIIYFPHKYCSIFLKFDCALLALDQKVRAYS